MADFLLTSVELGKRCAHLSRHLLDRWDKTQNGPKPLMTQARFQSPTRICHVKNPAKTGCVICTGFINDLHVSSRHTDQSSMVINIPVLNDQQGRSSVRRRGPRQPVTHQAIFNKDLATNIMAIDCEMVTATKNDGSLNGKGKTATWMPAGRCTITNSEHQLVWIASSTVPRASNSSRIETAMLWTAPRDDSP